MVWRCGTLLQAEYDATPFKNGTCRQGKHLITLSERWHMVDSPRWHASQSWHCAALASTTVHQLRSQPGL
jgi:hypothetical protein